MYCKLYCTVTGKTVSEYSIQTRNVHTHTYEATAWTHTQHTHSCVPEVCVGGYEIEGSWFSPWFTHIKAAICKLLDFSFSSLSIFWTLLIPVVLSVFLPRRWIAAFGFLLLLRALYKNMQMEINFPLLFCHRFNLPLSSPNVPHPVPLTSHFLLLIQFLFLHRPAPAYIFFLTICF